MRLLGLLLLLLLCSCPLVPPNNPPVPIPSPSPVAEKSIPYSLVGVFRDYKVGKDGIGYLLQQNGRQLFLSRIGPEETSFSSPELVTNECNTNSPYFMLPKLAITTNRIFVGWGVSSKKPQGMTVIRKGMTDKAWTFPYKILQDRNLEQFNFEGSRNELIGLAFDLVSEGLVLFRNDGELIRSFPIASKTIRTFSDGSSVGFVGRFKKVYSLSYDGIAPTLVQFPWYVAEPSGMASLAFGWTDYQQEGDRFYPLSLALLDAKAGLLRTLRRVTREEGLSTSQQTGVFQAKSGERFGVYDLGGRIILVSLNTGETTELGAGRIRMVYSSSTPGRADVVLEDRIIRLDR